MQIVPDERIYWKKVAEGDEMAFRKIFHSYNQRLFPFVLKMVKEEVAAEEIVQDTFIKIWENRASIGEMENPGGYVFTISTNKTLNYLKKAANDTRLREKLLLRVKDEQNYAEELLAYKESNELIKGLVELLPPQRKLIYHLSREEGLGYDDIAAQLKISRHTVKNQLVDALRFLRTELKKADRHIPVGLLLLFKGLY